MVLPDTQPIPVQAGPPDAPGAPDGSVAPTDPTLVEGFPSVPADGAPAPSAGMDRFLPLWDGSKPPRTPPSVPPFMLPPFMPPPSRPAPSVPPPSHPSTSQPATSGSPDGPVEPGTGSDGTGTVLDSRWAQHSRVTRLLCATAHLHGEYAENTEAALLDPSFTALAPSWGMDPVALAQHAKQACDRRRERDANLRYCLAAMVGIPLLLVFLALSQGLRPFNVAVAIILVTALALATAWNFVFQHYELIRLSVIDVINPEKSPRDLAPALNPATHHRLEDLAEGDTVVFGGHQPFIGCGVTLDSWTICVDLTGDAIGQGAVDPLPFDALELHEHLLRTVPAMNPGGLWAAPRLFVAGPAAKAVPGLVPDPYGADTWPASRLGRDYLDRYTIAPTETARTYACLAMPAWQGEVVLSVLTRAEVAGSRLFVEGRTHALMPPKPVFRESKYVPRRGWRARRAVCKATLPVFLPLLLNSFHRKLELVNATRNFKRNRKRTRRELADGYPFNYGASTSLREDVADPGELKYFATVDEVLSYRFLKRQIFATIQDFLAGHAVDVADFRRQADAALAETTVHLHDLTASGESFGPKSTVTVRDLSPTPT
jgi:hypothetical protein